MIEGACWVRLKNERRAVVNAGIKVRVSGNAGNLFTSSHSSKYFTRLW